MSFDYDVNQDGLVTALDALRVINFLGRIRLAGEGESESEISRQPETGSPLSAKLPLPLSVDRCFEQEMGENEFDVRAMAWPNPGRSRDLRRTDVEWWPVEDACPGVDEILAMIAPDVAAEHDWTEVESGDALRAYAMP